MNDFVEEAVQAAAADMGTVQAAADAISGAIGQVKPLLSGQTWTGPAADAWEGGRRSNSSPSTPPPPGQASQARVRPREGLDTIGQRPQRPQMPRCGTRLN